MSEWKNFRVTPTISLLIVFLLIALRAQAAEPVTLREAAQARGKLVGFAMFGKPGQEAKYDETSAREFNVVVCENAMKFGCVCPNARGQYDFNVPDAIVGFAQTNSMKVRGHCLVWHFQQPNWFSRGHWSKQEMANIVREHIRTMLTHYKGKVFAWDVVNEAISDSADPKDIYRKDNYYDVLGSNYLDMAFRWAREADPKAKLFYNEYGTEFGGVKFEKMYEMLKGMKARGVPVDGVGLQMHIGLGAKGQTKKLAGTIRRLAELGLEVQITELDVAIDLPSNDRKLQTQAEIFGDVAATAMNEKACTALLMWGFTDKHSWLPQFSDGKRGCGLIFDEQYRPKPAYEAMLKAMMR
ncbi:MAG: endo-1,4-beta-xylanase [Limisphaerales bacterium]